MSPKMTRVLVIGGTGFIGQVVARRFAARGSTACVLHRGKTAWEKPTGVDEVVGDRDDAAFLNQAVAAFRPDVVLDLISYTETHAGAVVKALAGRCGRLVTVSSADVYRNYDGLRRRGDAPPDPLPLTETAPLRDVLYPYRDGTTPNTDNWIAHYEKLLVERTVLGTSDVTGSVVRLCKVYGPGDPQRHLAGYLRRVLDGGSEILLEPGRAGWRWTRGYVDDVAEAIVTVVLDERSAGRIYNVGERDTPTEAEWLRDVARAAGREVTVREVPVAAIPEADRVGWDWRFGLAVSTQRIRDELGFAEVVERRDGVYRTVAHELSAPVRREAGGAG